MHITWYHVNMKEEKFEAIVLRATEFKENSRILTLFTKEDGLHSLIIRGLKSGERLTLATPFCQAEYLCRKGNSNLYTFQDGSILDLHLPLRSNLKLLQIAGQFTQDILKTQLPGKPAPQLYALFSSYLKRISVFTDLTTALTSFRLKLMAHEGYLSWDEESPLMTQLTLVEKQQAENLCACKSFQVLQNLFTELSLEKKIDKMIQNINLYCE